LCTFKAKSSIIFHPYGSEKNIQVKPIKLTPLLFMQHQVDREETAQIFIVGRGFLDLV
jgi:hypothetical protein